MATLVDLWISLKWETFFFIFIRFLNLFWMVFLWTSEMEAFPLKVCWWDTRKGGAPEAVISLQSSHIEPVYKVPLLSVCLFYPSVFYEILDNVNLTRRCGSQARPTASSSQPQQMAPSCGGTSGNRTKHQNQFLLLWQNCPQNKRQKTLHQEET